MNALQKFLFPILSCLIFAGCASKPFQPPPPTFLSFTKEMASTSDVKEALYECGYPNVISGRHSDDLLEKLNEREFCMFAKGFKRTDGYGGACYVEPYKRTSVCQGLIGGNPPTGGTLPEGSSPLREAVRAATGQPITVHNCYGVAGSDKCKEFWQDSGTIPHLIPVIPKATP